MTSLTHKIYIIIIVAIWLSYTSIFAAAQLRINDNTWQLIGYPGDYHIEGIGTYAEDLSREVYSEVDSNTTWFKFDNSFGLGYNAQDSFSKTYTTNTNQLNSSFGVFLFKDAKFESSVYATEARSIVRFKFPTYKPRVESLLFSYAYYKAGTDDVVIKISYQSDHTGDLFRVNFNNLYYTGHIDEYSFENPGVLIKELDSIEDTKSLLNIKDVFDFNISDNNITSMRNGLFGEESITTHDESTDYGLIVYYFNESGQWDVYNGANIYDSSLKIFTKGKGYWVRTTNKKADADPTGTLTGLIHTDRPYLPSKYYENIRNHWNLLSFVDSSFAYSPSGIFVPVGVLEVGNGGGLNIFFSAENNSSDTYDGNITVAIDGVNSTSVNACQYINIASQYNKDIFGAEITMRAFPAMNAQEEAGIIILANTVFEINSTNSSIVTLAGLDMLRTISNFQASTRDEKMIGIDIREDINATDLNASIEFTSLNGDDVIVTDLNDSNKSQMLLSLVNALGQLNDESSGYLVKINFEQNNSYDTQDEFTKVLLASRDLFAIRDSVYVKAFKLEADGVFRVIGVKGSGTVDINSELDNGADGIVRLTDSFASKLGVKLKSVGAGVEEVILLIGSTNKIDILENDEKNIFTDISLDSFLIKEEERSQGSIQGYFSSQDIFNLPVMMDTNLTDYNLSFARMDSVKENLNTHYGTLNILNFNLHANTDFKANPVWTPYYDNFSPASVLASASKDLMAILSLEHSASKGDYWRHLDLTKDPSKWYENGNNSQGLFAISSNKGYFVKVKALDALEKKDKNITSRFKYRNIYHFNNTLVEGVGKTSNHIQHTLYFSFDPIFINPADNPFYQVSVNFLGREFNMQGSSSEFKFQFDDIALNLEAKKPNEDNYNVFIQAYDGLGNSYEIEDRPKIEFLFTPPEIPKFDYDDEGSLVYLNPANDIYLESYRGSVKDLEDERNKVLLSSNKLRYAIAWRHPFDSSFDGLTYPIRFLAKNTESLLYSDLFAILYAPIKTSHILEVDEETLVDISPYSLIIDSQLQNNYGVSMELLNPERDKKVVLVYYPELRHNESEVFPSTLSSPVFLKVSNDVNTNDSPIVTISYNPRYIGKKFYVSFGGNLYQGTFPQLETFNTDTPAYDLSSKILNVDSVANASSDGSITDQSSSTGGAMIVSNTLHNQDIGLLPDKTGPLPILFSFPSPVVDKNGSLFTPAYFFPY